MTTLFIDTETYSDVDLRKGNVYTYTESKAFEVTLTAWRVDDGETIVSEGVPSEVIELLDDRTVIKVAHNAMFDRVALSKYSKTTGRGEYLNPRGWYCTMIAARHAGYPGKLKDAALAAGLTPKDEAGSRLIRLFALPNKEGVKNDPSAYPEDWEAFKLYAKQDVDTMCELYDAVQNLAPRQVWRDYWLDQKINDRGIPVDGVLVQAASAQAVEKSQAALAELKELTGLSNPNSIAQLLKFFKENGYKKDSLAKEHLTRLAESGRDHVLVKASELRLRTNSASVKKFDAFTRLTSKDNRLRGQFRFYGAHTGRWAGTGVQLQNLPSALPADPNEIGPDKCLEALAKSVKAGEVVNHLDDLKPLIRGSIRSRNFCVVDFSAIEARVLAWLAEEEWALQAFRDGEDLYVSTAKRMGPQYGRKEGKVATLALGYGGGVKALQAMGGDAIGDEKAQQAVVTAWRGANPHIKQFWSNLERAFQGSGQVGLINIESDGPGHRRVILPSGRDLNYRRVGRSADGLHYIGIQKEKKKLWGGILTENVVQAVARDILAEAMYNLHMEGYKIVGHVHDEVIIEAPKGELEKVTEIMTRLPSWASGLPLGAEGYTCSRYRKD